MINLIFSLVIPVAQLYMLFRIWHELREIAVDSERKDELNKSIEKFGEMFAEAAEKTKASRKKVVSFEVNDPEK